jgi:hypothetical protein
MGKICSHEIQGRKSDYGDNLGSNFDLPAPDSQAKMLPKAAGSRKLTVQSSSSSPIAGCTQTRKQEPPLPSPNSKGGTGAAATTGGGAGNPCVHAHALRRTAAGGWGTRRPARGARVRRPPLCSQGEVLHHGATAMPAS